MIASHHAIDLTDIRFKPSRMRALRPEKVAELAESMAARGLLQPIVVRPDGKRYWLIVGRHRLKAARKLKWTSISATVVDGVEADQAELIEIDENLIRAELSPAERALYVARRKELNEILHPETKHGGDRKSAKARSSRQIGKSKERFTKETAKRTGQSERKIQRDAARADKVAVLADIAGTSLDKGDEIDALAKLPEDEQRKLAERAQAGDKVSAKTRVAEREQELAEKTAAAATAKEPEAEELAKEPPESKPAEPGSAEPQKRSDQPSCHSNAEWVAGEIATQIGKLRDYCFEWDNRPSPAQLVAALQPEDRRRLVAHAQPLANWLTKIIESTQLPPPETSTESPDLASDVTRITAFRLWLETMSPAEIAAGLSREGRRTFLDDYRAIAEWFGKVSASLRDVSLAADLRVRLKRTNGGADDKDAPP